MVGIVGYGAYVPRYRIKAEVIAQQWGADPVAIAKFETVNLSDEGTLVTFTVVRVASDKFSKETPFPVGIVELNDGVRVTAQIADADIDELKVGQRVRLVLRKIQEDGKAGILCYGYKAVVA